MSTRYALIMAGGSGERFFPLSRQHRPKQLLPLLGDGRTLLEHTVQRCRRILPPENILIITSATLREPIGELLRGEVPTDNIIAEPAKRNTAGCLTLGAALLQVRGYSDATVAALPADHFISDDATFARQLDAAFAYAEVHPVIVTLGIPPTRPETGYGYIELDSQLEGDFYRVRQFREKPDRATAEQFLASGQFLWNSGMFIYRLSVFTDHLHRYAPEYAAGLAAITSALSAGDSTALSHAFGALPNLSIDYALMEKAKEIVVQRAAFGWDDLGSWDSLIRILPHDAAGNVTAGRCIALDTSRSILANYAERPLLLCTLGVENVVAVVTDDVVMVCSLDQVQQVRRIVEHLRSSGMEEWL